MKKNNSLILSTPYIIWMVIFTLIPLGVVAYYAFTNPNTGAFSMKNILELQNVYHGERAGIGIGEGIVGHHAQRDQGKDHHPDNIGAA